MAFERLYLVSYLLCICLLSSWPVRGRRHVPMVNMMKGMTQNVSLFAKGGYHKEYLDEPNRIKHFARYTASRTNYFGTKADIYVYGLPQVQANQFSAAQIWVNNGDNGIEAGWHVQPSLYGDSDTHFFVYWTADGYQKTGCYNFGCKGFVVHESAKLYPGNRLGPLSIIGGEQRYITLKITKERGSGDWWLYSGVNGDIPVGYWPRTLFTSLADNPASEVIWGGVVSFIKGENSPPMGSGLGPHAGDKQAAAFKHIKFIDEDGSEHDPDDGDASQDVDADSCYSVSTLDDSRRHGGSDAWRFYFGGGGGCTD